MPSNHNDKDSIQLKQAYEILRDREEKISKIEQVAHVGYWDCDYLQGLMTFSDETCRIFGWRKKGTVALEEWREKFRQSVHPDDRPTLKKAVEQTLQKGIPFNQEFRIVKPDKEIRIVHAIGEVTWRETGLPLRVLGTIHDITESKQIEEALQVREQEFRTLAENSPDVIVRYDRQCKRVYVNPMYEKTVGVPKTKALGSDLVADQWLGSIHLDEYRSRLKQVIETGIPDVVLLGWPNQIGEATLHELKIVQEKGPDGKIIGALMIGRDITALKESEMMFRNLVENWPDRIARYDTERRLVYANPALKETYSHVKQGQGRGRTPSQILQGNMAISDYEQKIQHVLDTGEIQDFEFEVDPLHGGQNRYRQCRLVPEFDTDGKITGVLSFTSDISAQKQADKERLGRLWFFESMDRVNKVLQSADTLENMMSDVLNTVLSIFECDRAYLLFPLDPEAASWGIPMEATRSEYPGFFRFGQQVSMTPAAAQEFRLQLDSDGPLQFNTAQTHQDLEPVKRDKFQVRSEMAIALHPKVGRPWRFGLHQCSHEKIWTKEEEQLFQEISRRLSDGLTSLISYRDLRQNEKLLNNIVNNIPATIFVKDSDKLEFVMLNKTGEKLFGYSQAEVLGKTDFDLFPQEVANMFRSWDKRVLKSKELIDIPEETLTNRENEKRILHTKKITIPDDSGESEYLLGIAEDVTELRHAEEFVRRLSQAIEQSPVSIVITDSSGTLEFVNSTFTRTTGYSLPEAIGCGLEILGSVECTAVEREQVWDTIRAGGVWKGEIQSKTKSGELFWEFMTISSIHNSEGVITHYVAVKEDVSERRELEAQLRQSQKMEAIGQLAGGVAHDFNNMLGVIMGYSELAMNQTEKSTPIFSALKEIHKAAGRSADLTRQLLAFARKQAVVPKVLDLNETVEGMLNMLHRLIGEGVDLAWLPGPHKWLVKVDPSQVDQILANLCVNARDAIDGVGKVTIETDKVLFDETYCADHPGSVPGEFVMLAVSDNGCGMDSKTCDRIFEPFFTTKELGKGTGLGMAMVYGIVKQNNGYITVESEPGRGATLKIYFPRHLADTRQEQKDAVDPDLEKGNETILLVDDEQAILNMGKSILEDLGYQILTASKPSEAIQLAKEYPSNINLLLTDMVLPEMNGYELAKDITSLRPGLRCLFMTGYTDPSITPHGFLDENIEFVRKPFSIQNLAMKVREVLQSSI